MQAPAQLQATIELLDEIEEHAYPADRTMAAYFKQRRYIGSKDKAVISEYFYTVLRNRLSFDYLLEQAGLSSNSRRRAAVMLKFQAQSIGDFFNGQGHGPKPLSESDTTALNSIDFNDLESAPSNVKLNVPKWLEDKFKQVLNERYEDEMVATNQQATTDIRVNTLQSTSKQVRHFLKQSQLEAKPSPLSPWGLRFDRRVALFGLQAFKEGWFEVQDEGSQLLALATKVKPGFKVVDFCAGAGGKTLAMAAMMQNKGTIYASDVHSKRLEQLSKRTKRAGVHNVRTHVLGSENDKWVKKHKAIADVVLIDAPCSGTGTWRRSPDSRWNLKPEDLENLAKIQTSILQSAKRLVKPSGVLLYATCSLLEEENEAQVAQFLENNAEFVPSENYFDDLGLNDQLVELNNSTMRTYPGLSGTDGFFVAAMERLEEVAE